MENLIHIDGLSIERFNNDEKEDKKMMFLIAVIAALCGLACLVLGEITSWVFFLTLAKVCGVVVVVSLLVLCIKFVFELFS